MGGDRLGTVQGRDPGQRRFDAPFEMDGKIGNQHAGRNVHRFGPAEQSRAQELAFELDHVESRRFEGNTYDFEGLGSVKLRDGERCCPRACGRAEHRLVPILTRPVAYLFDPEQHLIRSDGRDLEDLALELGLNLLILPERQLSRRIDVLLPFRHLHHASGNCRLDVSERDRKQRRIGFELQYAEVGRELGQRRILVGFDRERKFVGVGERPSRVIFHSGRQLNRECRQLREWPLERDRLGKGV